ncbi:hypothetical protein V5735_03615 (plasmid) [Haladaptatus sp. SPP-AMP-3]|uniref:hypothetical protein n=1 Tax=Haladaptatus sp. SPP-AMP-3 TaxID=3121295 RepID=UPI003C2B8329
MSLTTSFQYSPTQERDFWVELEIPHGLYKSKWDDHSDRLERLVEGSSILKRHFTPHWEIVETKSIPSKTVAIQTLISDYPEWARSILSAYEFSLNTNEDLVLAQLNDISLEDDNPLSSHVDTAIDRSDKKFAIILLDLLEPERLKDIYILSYLRRRSPIKTFEVTNTDDPFEDIAESEILGEINDKSRESHIWHRFDADGDSLLVIKVHEEDDVRVQPDTNTEVEEAEILILKSTSEGIQVYSSDSGFLGATRRGIQKGIETADNDIDQCDVTPSDEIISHQEYDDAVEKIESGDLGSDLVLHKLYVENAPLAGSPKLRLMDAIGGLSNTLDDFRSKDIELLADPDSVEQIGISYQNRVFTLYPSTDDSGVRLRYRPSVNDEQLLRDFESEIEQTLGVSVIFEKK